MSKKAKHFDVGVPNEKKVHAWTYKDSKDALK